MRAALSALRHRACDPEQQAGVCDAAVLLAGRALDALEAQEHPPVDAPAPISEAEVTALRHAMHETNAALENKLEEISLLRSITDTTSRAVRAADPFRLLLEKIVHLLHADRGSIMLVDWIARQLVVRAEFGCAADAPHPEQYNLDDVVAGRVARENAPLLISDLATFDGERPRLGAECTQGAVICFPLTVQNQSIGVITLQSDTPHAFTDETMRVAYIMAGQLAVAIENSRLYDEIKETKDYLENLVDRASASIFTLDRQGRVDSWNAGAREMYRLPAREVLGRGPEAFVPAPDLELVQQVLEEVLRNGEAQTLLAAGQGGDGTLITTHLTFSPIRDSSGSIVGVSGIGRDVTEQQRIEAELRSLNEAKSNFVAMVSHELRTPLTSVKSFVEIMIDDSAPTPPEKIKRYLRIINQECDRLDKLISDLLYLQKTESGAMRIRRERVVMADLVERARQLYSPVAQQREVELVTEIADAMPPGIIDGDGDKLYQVLGNLLNNALKFTPRKGRIVIRQETRETALRITVTDSGPGLRPEEIDHVFEKFYQVDNTKTRHVEGTGLGLAICLAIVEAHDGRIWAESKAGEGATFCVSLPRQAG